MEPYIKITQLNDFIFCPLSIYFHSLYGQAAPALYEVKAQINGKHAHDAVEKRRYSTSKRILQGTEVFSQKYNLCGKIDIFDIENAILTERKKHINKIYDGYVFQLYAQYFCLNEMGYKVEKLRLYSYDDNKIFSVENPKNNKEMFNKFNRVINEINKFSTNDYVPQNKEKCRNCIYEPMCDRSIL